MVQEFVFQGIRIFWKRLVTAQKKQICVFFKLYLEYEIAQCEDGGK